MLVRVSVSASSSSAVRPNDSSAAANASSVGANTVNGPGPESVSTNPAASTAATSVVNEPAAAATSTIVPGAAVVPAGALLPPAALSGAIVISGAIVLCGDTVAVAACVVSAGDVAAASSSSSPQAVSARQADANVIAPMFRARIQTPCCVRVHVVRSCTGRWMQVCAGGARSGAVTLEWTRAEHWHAHRTTDPTPGRCRARGAPPRGGGEWAHVVGDRYVVGQGRDRYSRGVRIHHSRDGRGETPWLGASRDAPRTRQPMALRGVRVTGSGHHLTGRRPHDRLVVRCRLLV